MFTPHNFLFTYKKKFLLPTVKFELTIVISEATITVVCPRLMRNIPIPLAICVE